MEINTLSDEVDSKILNIQIAIEKLRFNSLDIEFRQKYAIKEGGFEDTRSIEDWKQALETDKPNYKRFQKDLVKLSKSLKIDVETLKNYLVFGAMTFSEESLTLKYEWNPNIKQKELWLKIKGITRRDDISKNWNRIILPYQKKLTDYKPYVRTKKRKLSRSDFYVKKYTYKLNSSNPNLSYNDIWKKLKRLGVKLEPSNVGNLIANYKKEMKLNIKI